MAEEKPNNNTKFFNIFTAIIAGLVLSGVTWLWNSSRLLTIVEKEISDIKALMDRQVNDINHLRQHADTTTTQIALVEFQINEARTRLEKLEAFANRGNRFTADDGAKMASDLNKRMDDLREKLEKIPKR